MTAADGSTFLASPLALSGSESYACALLERGRVVCWGTNLSETFGYPTAVARPWADTTTPVPGVPR